MDDDDIVFQILSEKGDKSKDKEETKNTNSILDDKPEEIQITEKNEKIILNEERQKKLKDEEKFFIPNIQNPIDFVNYIEIEQSNTKIAQAYSNFIIKNHRINTKLKSVLEIEPHLDINKTIFSNNNEEILSIYLKYDDLILCNNIGNIIFYSLQQKKITKTIKYPEKFFSLSVVKDSDKIINCLDITDEQDYLFVGYNSGIINIFDLNKNSCKYSTSKIHNNSPCIEIKYSHKEKYDFHLLSCDQNGNVYYNIFRIGALGWRLVSSDKLIENKAIPIFILKFIRPKEYIKNIPSIQDLHQTAIFASMDSIYIYTLEPEINQIECITKPDYILENYVPDIQIGIGKALVNYKLEEINDTNKLIMAICWGKIIMFYELIIKDKFISMVNILGNYINDSPILKSGFLGNSILYFIDENLILKIINTRKANFGNIKLIPFTKRVKVPKINSEAELQRETLLDRNILYQQKISDPEDKNIKKNIYQYTIIENNYSLYILCKNSIYFGALVDWKEFLNKLSQSEDYLSMFSIGIDIYKGKMNALLNIPQEEENRKKIIGGFLRDEISKYVIFSTGTKKSGAFISMEDQNLINDCMNISIDLCIEIDSFDYLIKNLEPIFDGIEYGDYFLTKLEPFILYDRIKDIILKEDIIENIIKLYVDKKMKDILGQLLLHLNIKCLENEHIKKRIEELNLNSTLIYLYMNGDKEDYFEPIKIMYQYFCSLPDLKDFINYNQSLKKYNLSDILKSKQYYGHKILWYIKLCLTGRKFPNTEEKMKQELFNKLIPDITYWLLEEKVMNSFLYFDCKNYFNILQNIFSLQIYYKMLEETSKDNNMKFKICAALYNEKYQLSDIEPLCLIEYLINLCKDKEDNIKLSSFIFVIMCAKNNNINIDKKLKKDAVIFVLCNYEKISHENNNAEISLLTRNIIELLDNKYVFNDYDLDSIYENINSDIFDEVSFYILNKIKKYHKCLELLIKPKTSINNRIETLFNWISNTHKLLALNEKGINEFKVDVKNKLCEIANINLIKFDEMIKEIFPGERKMALEKLFSKNKQLCLNYIELLISKYNNILERDEEIDFSNQEFINYFLILHIKLLCEFKKFDEVIKAVESKNVIYPFHETLKLCSENNIYDAMIYLYKINGESLNGVEQCLERINTNFQTFICDVENNKVLNADSIDEKYIFVNRKYLNEGVQVCEHNAESIEEELWFKLINNLYEMDEKIKEKSDMNVNNIPIKNLIDYFHEQLIKDIRETLEKLCSYVDIKKILNLISEKNKNRGFEDFKDLIMKILFNYGRERQIFQSTKNLLTDLIFKNEKTFQVMNQEGELLDLEKCHQCKKNFEEQTSKSSILLFKCKHIFHFECAKRERTENGIEIICPICRELDIEQEINTKNSLIMRKSIKLVNNFSSKKELPTNISANKQNIIKKLKRFDLKLKTKKRISIENNLKDIE